MVQKNYVEKFRAGKRGIGREEVGKKELLERKSILERERA